MHSYRARLNLWSKSSLLYDSSLELAVRISLSNESQLKELPGVSWLRSWSSLEAAVARVFALEDTLTGLLISCPLTELGGANRFNDCCWLDPKLTVRSAEAELPVELDLLCVQMSGGLVVLAYTPSVTDRPASALTSFKRTSPGVELSPKHEDWSALINSSSTSMEALSPLGMALSTGPTEPAP